MAKKSKSLHPDAPLLHADHPRPVTRRDFIRQGFMTGGAVVTGSTLFNALLPGMANATLAGDVQAMDTGTNCVVGAAGALKLPFMCFDLGGGANLVGSNAIVGGPGGQLDTAAISTQGYSRLGVPGDRLPDPSTPGLNTNSAVGLVFHSESALLAGMLDKMSPAAAALTNGAVIPARSDNDTGNNQHNPMYGIAQAGASGGLLTLIGSRATESGARSMAAGGYDQTTANIFINPEIRPTKVDRPSDVTGLVDTGELLSILNQQDATRVMEAVARISDSQITGIDGGFQTNNTANTTALKQLLRCAYVKSADIADRYADPQALNPAADTDIVGGAGIFTQAEFDGSGEFRKVASVMKLVVGTEAGAGTVNMGGYDYHTGDRVTGERRDIRAGRSIGAAIEYAHRVGRPLMVYVYSDGSVFSNGNPDGTQIVDGNITLPGGKGQWTGDNSGGAASLIFVYDPASRPGIRGGTVAEQAARQQLGYFRNNGSVETSARTPGGFPILAANNVNSLAETVILNYIACHNDTDVATIAEFNSKFPNHSLGSDTALAELLIFNRLPSIDPSTGQIT